MNKQIFFLLFLVHWLVACTADLEPIVLTRMTETAVAATPTSMPSHTPTIMPTATAVPTLLPSSTFISQDSLQFDDTPTPLPLPTVTPYPLALGTARILGRGRILEADFSADGRTLAVAWGGGVSLMDVADTHERWWQPLDTSLVAMDMQASGEAIAVAMTDGSVIVINAAGERQSYAVADDDNYWGAVAWSPDNSQIAVQFLQTAARGTPIYLLDVSTSTVSEVPNSKVATGVQPYLLWSPDGTLLSVSALNEDCGRLIDIHTGQTQFELKQGEGCYDSHGMAWSPDGRTLAVATGEGTIDLLNLPDTNPVQRITGSILSFPPLGGQPLFFSEDGRYLASKGGAGFYGDSYPLNVWQVDTGESIAQSDTLFENRVSSAFMDDSLVTLHTDGSLVHWDFTGTGEEMVVGRLPVQVGEYEWHWSGDGRYLAGRQLPDGLMVWDVDTGLPALVLTGQLAAPAFSPDEPLLAVTDLSQSQLLLYDLTTGQQQGALPGATSQRLGTAFAPDGQQIAYGVDNAVVLVDLATGRETAVLSGYPTDQSIVQIDWSPDGMALLAASGKMNGDDAAGEVVLWEQTADEVWTERFRVQNVQVTYPGPAPALFNPSGNLVAFESLPQPDAAEFQIFVYDRQQQDVILNLEEYQLTAWQSDELLLTSEAQYWVYLTQWHVRQGTKVVGNATGDGGQQYSPDGLFFAHSSYTGRNVDIRDWARGDLIAKGEAVRLNLIWIGWSPDGRFLGVSADDGTVIIWPVTLNP